MINIFGKNFELETYSAHAMATRKKAFNFEIPGWRKAANNFGTERLTFGILALGLVIIALPLMRIGLRNNKIREKKETWIRDRVLNENADEFAKLDMEAPPIPVRPMTELEKFRAEFAKIRSAVENR